LSKWSDHEIHFKLRTATCCKSGIIVVIPNDLLYSEVYVLGGSIASEGKVVTDKVGLYSYIARVIITSLSIQRHYSVPLIRVDLSQSISRHYNFI
jgi:hypothetical protein